ncbi:MAG TPA: alpha/beta hydrolase [Xanthobacteraceae bacterium]|nr:alpha/beta hydrolase [Xanthobacteraceae bacterium]
MQENRDLGFIHRFVPAEAEGKTPLLLLHGTGGSEDDLLPLGQQLSPGSALLSPRGKVLENGMPRFFRRHGEGVFDIDDLRARTEELAKFLEAARAHYGIGKPIALGFSNGANIAWSLMLARPDALAGAILLRGMLPFDPPEKPALNGMPVLIVNGNMDPIVPSEVHRKLADTLRGLGADLRYEVLSASHQLTRQDLAIAAGWLNAR